MPALSTRRNSNCGKSDDMSDCEKYFSCSSGRPPVAPTTALDPGSAVIWSWIRAVHRDYDAVHCAQRQKSCRRAGFQTHPCLKMVPVGIIVSVCHRNQVHRRAVNTHLDLRSAVVIAQRIRTRSEPDSPSESFPTA